MTKNKNQLIEDLLQVWYTHPILDTPTVSKLDRIVNELAKSIGRTPEDYQL